MPDKPSTALSEDHSASKATVFKKKQTKKPRKENMSELLSGNKLILKPPLKIDEVIEHLTSNKNNIEVLKVIGQSEIAIFHYCVYFKFVTVMLFVAISQKLSE